MKLVMDGIDQHRRCETWTALRAAPGDRLRQATGILQEHRVAAWGPISAQPIDRIAGDGRVGEEGALLILRWLTGCNLRQAKDHSQTRMCRHRMTRPLLDFDAERFPCLALFFPPDGRRMDQQRAAIGGLPSTGLMPFDEHDRREGGPRFPEGHNADLSGLRAHRSPPTNEDVRCSAIPGGNESPSNGNGGPPLNERVVLEVVMTSSLKRKSSCP